MTTIKVENVWKEYGDQIVLENINLEFAPHSFIALVGPSGCGKSTFLRMLLSQETPTRGSITVDGAPLAGEPQPDRGVVFQKYSVYPHLTAVQNVALGLELERAPILGRLYGSRKREALDEAREALISVGLEAAVDKYPSQMSGGMQQRLAIAQALVKKPRILLLDEPFGALDPGIRKDIHDLMLDIWWETKMTVVMVSHDLREAFYLSNRVIAFERPRDRDEEKERFGATVTFDMDIDPADPIKEKIMLSEGKALLDTSGIESKGIEKTAETA